MYVIRRGDWGFKIKHINDVVDFLRINLTISDPWDKLFFELTNDHWVGGDFGDGGSAVSSEPGSFLLSRCHPPGQYDLKGTLAKRRFRRTRVNQFVSCETVKLIAMPVEFFLGSDHLAA